MIVKEFKNITELQDFLNQDVPLSSYQVLPVARMFEHPKSKLIVSCISYVLIIRRL
jgi:hypothetical protein